jgi:GT2 family glycosyltransferase
MRIDYDPGLYEVVVVDDGSLPAGPVERAVLESGGRAKKTLIRQGHAGPAAARNAGARIARFDLLAFTDDDCRPDPGWLRGLASSWGNCERRVVGGRTINALHQDFYATASQALVSYLTEFSRERGEPFLPSNNLALSRSLFLRLGGFDEGYPLAAGEDRDFCDRCVRDGCEMTFSQGAVVRHHHALTPARFLRQHFHYGRGAFVFHEARLHRGGARRRFETIGFYANLVGYPLRKRAGISPRFRIALLLAAAQAANAAGYFVERRQRRRSA